MSIQPYRISFDPSINNIGYCVWQGGKLVEIKTLHTKGEEQLDKLISLTGLLNALFAKYPPDKVAVEQFVKHCGKMKAHSMMQCSEARGLIIGSALRHGAEIIEICKGNRPKDDAALLAKQFGVKGSKDAKDALQFGVMAGFSNQ